jgi:uncharacterized protein YodC (DUF2158 family)
METFKTGDVVRLRSGGPPMTVVGTDQYDQVLYITVVWFEDHREKSGRYPAPALEPAAETPRAEA